MLQGNIQDGRTLNRYAYVNGNPVSLTDPFGLSPEMSPSNIGHNIIDVVGFWPGAGDIADGANGIWCILEGDYKNGALSFVKAIPFIGGGIADIVKGTKWGSKAFNVAKVGNKLIDAGNKAIDYSKIVAKNLAQEFSYVREAWKTTSKRAVYASSFGVGEAKKIVDTFKESKKNPLLCPCCFPGFPSYVCGENASNFKG